MLPDDRLQTTIVGAVVFAVRSILFETGSEGMLLERDGQPLAEIALGSPIPDVGALPGAKIVKGSGIKLE